MRVFVALVFSFQRARAAEHGQNSIDYGGIGGLPAEAVTGVSGKGMRRNARYVGLGLRMRLCFYVYIRDRFLLF